MGIVGMRWWVDLPRPDFWQLYWMLKKRKIPPMIIELTTPDFWALRGALKKQYAAKATEFKYFHLVRDSLSDAFYDIFCVTKSPAGDRCRELANCFSGLLFIYESPFASSLNSSSPYSFVSSKESIVERAVFQAGWSELSWSWRTQSVLA